MFIKGLLLLFGLFTTNAIPERKLQLLGSHLDNECVSDGGYVWCESTKSCIRPWITSCPVLKTATTECVNSPLQLCRMMCPPFNCPSNKCAMRSGRCCDYKCIDNKVSVNTKKNIPRNCISWFDGCNICTVTNGQIKSCTEMLCINKKEPECKFYLNQHRRMQSITPPTGCVNWFDGCNTCHRQGPTDPMVCTMMMCFRQSVPVCRGYAIGYGPDSRPIQVRPIQVVDMQSSNGLLNSRCASGFCENPNDCPRCQSSLICSTTTDMCAGTCYGICRQPIHH